jgi:hypothetical protein
MKRIMIVGVGAALMSIAPVNAADQCRLSGVGSTGRRNTLIF